MRRTRLADCNAHFVESEGVECAVYFECPEGHEDCKHVTPFAPALDGSAARWSSQGPIWQRTGDTIETLTLSPSIRRIPRYPDRAAAVAAGRLPEHVSETMLCALHIFIRNGAIEFCGDSR